MYLQDICAFLKKELSSKWCHRFNTLVARTGLCEGFNLIPNLGFASVKPAAPEVESGRAGGVGPGAAVRVGLGAAFCWVERGR